MKSVLTKKVLDKAVERALKAQYLVDTGVMGTLNMVLMTINNESFCKTWKIGDNADSGSQVRLQAYGSCQSGEVLISNFGNPPSIHLIGRGREEHGLLLLIQRTGNVYTLVWNSDLPENKAVFYMTATDDRLLVGLIGLLAEKNFPDINEGDLQNALTLLMEGDGNGE